MVEPLNACGLMNEQTRQQMSQGVRIGVISE